MKFSIDELRAAGVPDALIVRLVSEKVLTRKEQWRKDQQNQRSRQQKMADNADRPSLPFSLSSSLEKQGSRTSCESAEFVAFWQQYPHKVGKRAAQKSFAAARKRASADEIMAGLARYAAKTDDRPWCNPATWLNQDRWTDEPGPQPPPQPRQHNGGTNEYRKRGEITFGPDAIADRAWQRQRASRG